MIWTLTAVHRISVVGMFHTSRVVALSPTSATVCVWGVSMLSLCLRGFFQFPPQSNDLCCRHFKIVHSVWMCVTGILSCCTLYDAETQTVDLHRDERDVLYGWIYDILTLDTVSVVNLVFQHHFPYCGTCIFPKSLMYKSALFLVC